jgi:hypothetical protein
MPPAVSRNVKSNTNTHTNGNGNHHANGNGNGHGTSSGKINSKTDGKVMVHAKSNGNGASRSAAGGAKPEPKILFQKFFKSVGPRTYAAQVKELPNGNHLLVLTEGKRDSETQEVRKTRLFIYGEDFTALFRLLHETAAFIRANPLSEEVRQRRDRFWARKNRESDKRGAGADSKSE